MGDDDDGEGRCELAHESFDHLGRDRVERRGGFVQQQHLGPDGQCSCQTEQLLLTARESEWRVTQPVLHRVPEPDLAQASLGDHVELFALGDPVGLHARHHVVPDGHRERVRALEEHPHPPAQGQEVLVGFPDALVVEGHVALVGKPDDLVVHPVESPQEGGLPRSGGADEGGDGPPCKAHLDIVEDRLGPKAQLQGLGLHHMSRARPVGVERCEDWIERPRGRSARDLNRGAGFDRLLFGCHVDSRSRLVPFAGGPAAASPTVRGEAARPVHSHQPRDTVPRRVERLENGTETRGEILEISWLSRRSHYRGRSLVNRGQTAGKLCANNRAGPEGLVRRGAADRAVPRHSAGGPAQPGPSARLERGRRRGPETRSGSTWPTAIQRRSALPGGSDCGAVVGGDHRDHLSEQHHEQGPQREGTTEQDDAGWAREGRRQQRGDR